MGRLSLWHGYSEPAEAASYPTLVPLFGVQPLTPASPCPHHGLLPDDTQLCCMVCHRTGADAERRIAAVAAHERRHGLNQIVADASPSKIRHKPRGRK